jgi:hypothetical protein
MADKVTALVLAGAASAEPQSIPGVPGLWSTDESFAVHPEDLGMSLRDLTKLLDDNGVDYKRVQVKAKDAEDVPAEHLVTSAHDPNVRLRPGSDVLPDVAVGVVTAVGGEGAAAGPAGTTGSTSAAIAGAEAASAEAGG